MMRAQIRHGGKFLLLASLSLGCSGSNDDASSVDKSQGGSAGTSGGSSLNLGGSVAMQGGASNNAAGTNSTDPQIVDNVPTRLAAAFCKRIFECCSQEELAASPLGLVQGSCEVLFSVGVEQAVNRYKASVAAGRASYDPVAFDRCIARFASATCSELRGGQNGDCDAFFVPKVAVGGSCSSSDECIASYCNVTSSKCEAPKPNGAACQGEDDECQSAHCNRTICEAAPAAAGNICQL